MSCYHNLTTKKGFTKIYLFICRSFRCGQKASYNECLFSASSQYGSFLNRNLIKPGNFSNRRGGFFRNNIRETNWNTNVHSKHKISHISCSQRAAFTNRNTWCLVDILLSYLKQRALLEALIQMNKTKSFKET